MIRCNLSRMMGERKWKIQDAANASGVPRNTVGLLYHEKAARVELEVIEKLCRAFECSVGDMFELADDMPADKLLASDESKKPDQVEIK